jgi:hypothetical protein
LSHLPAFRSLQIQKLYIIQQKVNIFVPTSNFLIKFYCFILANIITNATQIIGDYLSPFTIYCNQSTLIPNQQITWIQTINKTGIYLVQNSDTVTISNGGQQLNFVQLALSNEEYYSCGYLLLNKFQIANNYFLYIRGFFSIIFLLVYFLYIHISLFQFFQLWL